MGMKMLKSSSMFYAIMVCTVVGICCSSLLLVSYYSNLFALQMETRTELLENNRSATNYYLAKAMALRENPESIDLFNNGIESRGKVEPWGLYNVLHVRSILKKDTVNRSMLIGQKPVPKPALYLIDNDKPLQMVGKAKIIGDVFVSKKGVKRGYLSSQSYSSSTYLEGDKYPSKNKLPEIKNNFFIPPKDHDTIVFIEELDKRELLFNPFWEVPLHIEANGNFIEGARLMGRIVLNAQDSIFIAKNNQLEDILISAPIVVFEKGFKGNVQIKASQKVVLEEDVLLKYPSSIYVNAISSEEARIDLAGNSKVLGKMVLVGAQGKESKVDIIHIDKGAEVIGDVFCSGNTALNGRIIGTLYTAKFYLKTKASTYENYIQDGVIDQQALSDKFLGNVVEDAQRAYGIIKQL